MNKGRSACFMGWKRLAE